MNEHQIYARQLKGFGIGNFVNMTPALQMLSKHLERPVPVWFQQKEIETLYEDCTFIKPIKKPLKKLVLCSSYINHVIPDWLYQSKIIKAKFNLDCEVPHTSVPKYENFAQLNHFVICRGMVSNRWATRKDPGDQIYKKIINFLEQNHQLVFIGADADFKRTHDRMIEWCEKEPLIIKNDIKTSASAILKSKGVITNDTGMYHVSAALKKKQFVMWKDTNFTKNKAPGKNNFFSFVGEWEKDFENFYKQFNETI